MPRITITREDIQRGKVLDPGWYPAEVVDVKESATKAGDSMNTTIEFKIIDGPSLGVTVYRLFNEKAPGFVIPFLQAFAVEIPEDGGTFDLQNTIGRKLSIYIKNELYNGAMKNRVEGFKSM